MSLRQRHHHVSSTGSIYTILFGICLLALAIPGLASQYYRQQAASIISDVTQGKAGLEIEELNEASQNLRTALWFEPANRTIDNNLATLSLRVYEKLISAGEQEQALLWLSHAHSILLSGLRAAPGDSNLWYLAGETNNRLNRPDSQSRTYLQMSYLTGQREYWVVRRRSELALRLWEGLSDGARQMLQREIQSLRVKDLSNIYLNSNVSQKIIILGEMTKKNSKEKFLRYINKKRK